jgi:hypothetical protein
LSTPGASFQDTGFNFKVWATAKTAYFTNDAFLHYRIDNESSSVKSLGKIYNVNKEYEDIEDYLRRHDLIGRLGAVMEYAKFGAYYWNLDRLPKKLAKEFLSAMRDDFTRADEQGLLDLNIFDPFKKRILEIILYRPSHFFPARRAHRIAKLPKRAIKKVLRAVSPGYRQRQHLVHLNQVIAEQNAYLKNDLRIIEEQLAKIQRTKDINAKTKD